MSKTIDTSFSASGMPFTAPTMLDHLQQNVAEGLRSLGQSLMGPGYSTNLVYRLWGAQITYPGGGDPNMYITAGACFYRGEILFMDAVTMNLAAVTVGMSSILVGIDTYIETTYADSTSSSSGTHFADNSVNAVCKIRKLRFRAQREDFSPTPSSSGGLTTDYSNPVLPVDYRPAFSNLNMTFGTGMGNYGSPYNSVMYKVNNNTVDLSGVFTGTLPSSGAPTNYIILRLPSACYPQNNVLFNQIVKDATGNYYDAFINTLGQLVVTAAGGTTLTCTLDGISYRIS